MTARSSDHEEEAPLPIERRLLVRPEDGCDDAIKQYFYRDADGELDGCYTYSSAEAIARAMKYRLTVVVRTWTHEDAVYWCPEEATVDPVDLRGAIGGAIAKAKRLVWDDVPNVFRKDA